MAIPTGAIRYNTDSNKMECFDGTKWWQVAVSSPDLDGGARGFNIGGYNPAYTDIIDYVTIPTAGDAIDFGNLNTATHVAAATASNTRALVGGGSPSTDEIQYFGMASKGNAADFGNLTDARYGLAAVGNSTRGIFVSGYTPGANKNTIDYVTVASLGDAKDFGDSIHPFYGGSSANSSTRGITGGGTNPTPGGSQVNAMQYMTIATTGNALDFGDMWRTQYYTHSCICSSTRGVFGGGYYPSAPSAQTTNIHYITMTTLGNSISFGDLSAARHSQTGTSSKVRGIFMGGRIVPSGNLKTNIDYITIATGGTAADFGDTTSSEPYGTATSNDHGGL